MSIDYTAHIYAGYELKDGWTDIISEDYFDEHEDNFIPLNSDGEVLLFAVEVNRVDCDGFMPLDLSMSDDENELLNHFIANYPKAAINQKPRYFLAGRISY